MSWFGGWFGNGQDTATLTPQQQAQKDLEDATRNTLKMVESLAKDPKFLYPFGMFPNAGSKEYGILSPLESCWVKVGIAGPAGLVMGIGFGAFFNMYGNSLAYDPLTEKMSVRDQMKVSFRQMWSAGFRTGKNFAAFGVLYSGLECMLEKYRATRDMRNAVYAGGLTGSFFAMKGGPKSMLMAGMGMAAISAGIEYYQHYM